MTAATGVGAARTQHGRSEHSDCYCAGTPTVLGPATPAQRSNDRFRNSNQRLTCCTWKCMVALRSCGALQWVQTACRHCTVDVVTAGRAWVMMAYRLQRCTSMASPSSACDSYRESYPPAICRNLPFFPVLHMVCLAWAMGDDTHGGPGLFVRFRSPWTWGGRVHPGPGKKVWTGSKLI